MKKVFISILVIASSLMGDYITNSDKYSLLKRATDDYMKLVEKAHTAKAFTKEELQNGLSKEDFHPMSDFLRVLAYDESRAFQGIEKHIKNIPNDSELLKRFPPLALAVADVMLRIGEYDLVLKMISREEIILLPKEQKYQGYYYRALAKYLKNAEISQEFLIVKYHFKITKEIHKEIIKKRNAQVRIR